MSPYAIRCGSAVRRCITLARAQEIARALLAQGGANVSEVRRADGSLVGAYIWSALTHAPLWRG